jgi:single-strand DNA-binding protein
MNKVILMGRLTRDVETRYSQGNEPMAIGRYTLAVDGRKEADFINCVAFGRAGEFAEKYFRKGMKVAITGRIQTGSYTDKDGKKVYTTDIVVEDQEFCESKQSAFAEGASKINAPIETEGFMSVPDNLDDDEFPF